MTWWQTGQLLNNHHSLIQQPTDNIQAHCHLVKNFMKENITSSSLPLTPCPLPRLRASAKFSTAQFQWEGLPRMLAFVEPTDGPAFASCHSGSSQTEQERQDFKRLTNSPLNWSQWERSQRWPVRWPHATRVPQGGKVRRQEMLKYFAGGECLPGRCPLPQATWQEGGSLVSPLVCTAQSEVMVDKISQTIRHQDDLSQRPIRTHQMKINPWASFALLNLNLHLHAAPFLSVCPNGVLTCSETYKQASKHRDKQRNKHKKRETNWQKSINWLTKK